jgi:hypothetical protein
MRGAGYEPVSERPPLTALVWAILTLPIALCRAISAERAT